MNIKHIDILLTDKELKLSSGKVVVIRRRGIAYYFALHFYHLQFSLAILNFKEGNAADSDVVTARNYYTRYLREFFTTNEPEITPKEESEIFNAINDFNLSDTLRDQLEEKRKKHPNPKPPMQPWEIEELMREIENNLLSVLSRLIYITGYTIDYIGENIDSVTAFYLNHNFNLCRASEITDNAFIEAGQAAERVKSLTGGGEYA